MPNAIVKVQSAWYSKVNWVAGVTALVASLTELAPFVPPKYQHYVSVAVIVLGGIATIYTRTFQSPTVTSASAEGAESVSVEQAVTAGMNFMNKSPDVIMATTNSGETVPLPATETTAKQIIKQFGPAKEQTVDDLNAASLAATSSKGT